MRPLASLYVILTSRVSWTFCFCEDDEFCKTCIFSQRSVYVSVNSGVVVFAFSLSHKFSNISGSDKISTIPQSSIWDPTQSQSTSHGSKHLVCVQQPSHEKQDGNCSPISPLGHPSSSLQQKLTSNSNIYLKLENLQPSASFKSRGIGNLMSLAISSHPPSTPLHFYCSSGGNAGLACATAAIALARPATIVVPTSTSSLIVSKLRTLGADVVVHGKHWSEADEYMRENLMGKDENAVYVPPFDHPHVWEGHGTIVDELEVQMRAVGGYDALVCSVGGGGLFVGIMEALERYNKLEESTYQKPVRVLAMETQGAESFNLSVRRGELSRLKEITSIATSLGATQIAEKAFEWGSHDVVTSCVFSDAEAAMASVCFADDERILVEPACGVSVAPAYNDTLSELLFPDVDPEEFKKLNVVIVVCGGSKATLQLLQEWKEEYGSGKLTSDPYFLEFEAIGCCGIFTFSKTDSLYR